MKNIVIVSGSHRPQSQSLKVSRFIQGRCAALFGTQAHILDLASLGLPLWDEGVWDNDPAWLDLWGPIAERLRSSTGVILVSPEWSGMVTPALKNFLLLCDARELGHKPSLLVSVSAGQGGAYPISELRSSGYKNNKACHIPEHVIVRHVETVLNEDTAQGEDDRDIRDRIDWCLRVFSLYDEALRHVRSDPELVYRHAYRFGM